MWFKSWLVGWLVGYMVSSWLVGWLVSSVANSVGCIDRIVDGLRVESICMSVPLWPVRFHRRPWSSGMLYLHRAWALIPVVMDKTESVHFGYYSQRPMAVVYQ